MNTGSHGILPATEVIPPNEFDTGGHRHLRDGGQAAVQQHQPYHDPATMTMGIPSRPNVPEPTNSPYFNATPLPSVEQNPSAQIPYPPSADTDRLLKSMGRFLIEQQNFMMISKDDADYQNALLRFSNEQARFIAAQSRALHQLGII